MTSNDLGSSIKHALYRQLGRASGRIQTHRTLAVDVLENETSYLVIFDVPGAETDDIQVRYIGGNVKVRVDRFRPFREEYAMRFPGRGMQLTGEAELPADAVVDPNAGTATLSDTGSLRIEIPKASALEGTADTEREERIDAEAENGSGNESESEGATATNDADRSESGELAID